MIGDFRHPKMPNPRWPSAPCRAHARTPRAVQRDPPLGGRVGTNKQTRHNTDAVRPTDRASTAHATLSVPIRAINQLAIGRRAVNRTSIGRQTNTPTCNKAKYSYRIVSLSIRGKSPRLPLPILPYISLGRRAPLPMVAGLRRASSARQPPYGHIAAL